MLVSCEALPFTKYDIRRLVISDVVKDLRLDRGQGLWFKDLDLKSEDKDKVL